MKIRAALTAALLTAMAALPAVADTPARLHIGGRVVVDAHKSVTLQWPGVYFEGTFEGDRLMISADDTNQYKVFVDGKLIGTLSRSAQAQTFKGLGKTHHRLRIEKISESQSKAATFSDITAKGLKPGAPRARQIEFIGDSFTVGYGNTSDKRECNEDEVWATTDTSQAFGPLTARHYDADYQINAFSGRGIVRNYNGFIGDTLPRLYPYALYDGKSAYHDAKWQPQIIVIGLGTNDFSTPLNATDKWKTREDLRADYRATYVAFVRQLRARNPQAQFILMASDQADGEIRAQVSEVAQTLTSDGETRLSTLFFSGLDYGGCHSHPSLADDRKLMGLLTDWIDAHPGVWTR